MKLMGYSNSGDDWPSVFISPDNSAHNVYYVKYGGFVLKFMCSALSVAYPPVVDIRKSIRAFTLFVLPAFLG